MSPERRVERRRIIGSKSRRAPHDGRELKLLDALDKAEANERKTQELATEIARSANAKDDEIARLRELAERMHWDVGWCYLNLEALQLPPDTRNEYFTERMTRAATLLDLFVFDEKKKTCKLREDWRLP